MSQRLFDNIFEWVQNGDSNPWFAYVHTLRPHSLYPPEEPYLSRFVDTSSVPPGQDAQEHFFNLERKFILSVFNTGWTAETDEQMVVMRRLYLANIQRIDAMLGELLQALDDAGQLENTLVVTMSDHGEAFGEHKNRYHSGTPYREVTHVPLLLIPPAAANFKPGRVSTSVEMTDLLPTLTDLFGIDDTLRRDGQSLVPLMRNDEGYLKPTIFTQSPYQLSVIREGQKLIYEIEKHTVTLPNGPEYTFEFKAKLYNLKDDPGEQHNLFPDENIDEQLRALGEHYMNAQKLNIPVELREPTDEEREVLESLGYVN